MHARAVTTLTPDLLECWHELLQEDVSRETPFLHPDYVRLAADIRSDVEVGVIEQNGDIVGFIPFQRSGLGIGGAVGSKLCDLSGALVTRDVSWDPLEMADALDLRALRLPNVPTAWTAWHPFQRDRYDAPIMDLTDGFGTYRTASLDSGSSLIRQLERKARKVEREVGPLRFEWHTSDMDVFETLLAWKAAQRRATGSPNVLDLPWARALVESLLHQRTESFAGVLSALYVGDTLAAAHFGIRTRRVLHYWVPAYNHELARYSPGLLALLELARSASERGVLRIDLGSGEETYKLRAANGAMEMALVTVSPHAALRAVTHTVDQVRSWSRTSRLGEILRATGRSVTRGTYAARSAFSTRQPTQTRDEAAEGVVTSGASRR